MQPTPEDGIGQEDVDAAYAEGAASVTVPGGDTYCDAESTDWDEVAGACVSSVEESMNCFQSGFCQMRDDFWGTGLPNSIVGNATRDECMSSPNNEDRAAWVGGTDVGITAQFVILSEICAQ